VESYRQNTTTIYKYYYLLWQNVSVLLDHRQSSIQRYEVQSVHVMYYWISYYLQGVNKNSLKPKEIVYIKSS